MAGKMGHFVVGIHWGQKGRNRKAGEVSDQIRRRQSALLLPDCRRRSGKTENATRQVVIHPKLIEWGFMDYVDRQWKERIFQKWQVRT